MILNLGSKIHTSYKPSPPGLFDSNFIHNCGGSLQSSYDANPIDIQSHGEL